MAKLLLIDDDREMLEINSLFFTGEGFTVFSASDPQKGLELAKEKQPDCMILDVMMPGMDGFTLCKKIRAFSSAPIIFLTGKSTENDKIEGLVTGGDDYMVKPYSLRELKARIDVQLRRSGISSSQSAAGVMSFGHLTINRLEHKALFKDVDLNLSNREFEVLVYLATHPGQDVTFEELGTALFGTYQEADRRSVMVNVSRLRKKMEISYELENMIETVWSKGYKFIAK